MAVTNERTVTATPVILMVRLMGDINDAKFNGRRQTADGTTDTDDLWL